MSDSDSNDGLENGMPPGYMPEEDFNMGTEPQPEEHLWLASLSKTNNVIKFEGCDDAESNLILKRATLEAACEDESRHVIEIISLDHEDKRISGTLCSLSLKNNCSVSLDSLTISPPTAFKLIKGSGPITISGNLMKEIDPTLLDDSEEEVEFEGNENEVNGVEDEDNEAKIEEMETSSEEGDEEEATKENKKPAANNSAKRKNTENNSNESSKKQKTDNIKAKIDANKVKAERAPINNAKDLIEAIRSSKGGRPSKRGKFDNWVKNQFKVENKEWVEKAWKVINEAK